MVASASLLLLHRNGGPAPKPKPSCPSPAFPSTHLEQPPPTLEVNSQGSPWVSCDIRGFRNPERAGGWLAGLLASRPSQLPVPPTPPHLGSRVLEGASCQEIQPLLCLPHPSPCVSCGPVLCRRALDSRALRAISISRHTGKAGDGRGTPSALGPPVGAPIPHCLSTMTIPKASATAQWLERLCSQESLRCMVCVVVGNVRRRRVPQESTTPGPDKVLFSSR